MPRSRITNHCCIRWSGVFAAILFITASWPLASVQADARPIGTKAQSERWAEALTCLGLGDFDKASKIISGIKAEGIQDEQVLQVDSWLTEFEKLQAERNQRRQKDYEKYVGWVKEEVQAAKEAGEKGKKLWQQAIGSCQLAFYNAENEDDFRQETWLAEAVEGALKAAAAYEQQEKWLDAATIYVSLKSIFPLNKTYREALEKCQAHIRLDVTYAPDSEWKDEVENIVPDMARYAFRKIESEYLTEPKFKDGVIAGLEHVLRLTEKPKLAKVFEKLNDEVALEEFRSRTQYRLQRAKLKNEITVDELIKDYFDKLLVINRETGLLPENVLIREFVYGALQTLDRYSDMIWPAEVQEFNKHTQGRFSGVGIQIRKAPGEPIKVVTPLDDTPAYRAGIQPGDLITGINGAPASKYTINKAVREITGPAGTYVTLTVKRLGEEKEFDVKLKRQEITIHTIKGHKRDPQGNWQFMIDPEHKVGYIRITHFTDSTIDELRDHVQQLQNDEGMKGLILDLRNNPGGTLKSAIEVSDLFLPSHKKIVSTKDRYGQPWAKSTSNEKHFTDFPMIVLANDASASASEIVTGALQVHQRALVVGERTFGKGSVQQLLHLTNSHMAMLKLTTALYYLPNDRCLHRDKDSTVWGVDPDVEVKLVPKEIRKVNDLRLKNDILKGKDQEQLTEENIKSVTEYKPSTTDKDEMDEQDKKEDSLTTDADGDEDEGDEGKDEDEDLPYISREDQDPNDWPEVDPQLEAALLLIQVRLTTDHPWPRRPVEIVASPIPDNDQ